MEHYFGSAWPGLMGMIESLLWSNWGSEQSPDSPHASGDFAKPSTPQAWSFLQKPRPWCKELALLSLLKHIYTLKPKVDVISLTYLVLPVELFMSHMKDAGYKMP